MQSELKEFEPYQIYRGLTFCTKRGQLKYLQTAFNLNFFQFYRDIASFDGFVYDLAITSLKLGMAMARLNKVRVAQFLERPAGAPIKFPNVARMVAEWIEGGRWEDLEGLVIHLQRET